MAEGPIHRETIQQNLVNYISHNLGRKADKEKDMEKEKTDCKNSSAKGIKVDRTSTNSASRPNRQKAGAQGQSAPSTQSSATKPMPCGQTPSEQNTTQIRNNTPSSSIPAKTRTPPSLEKANKPQKRLNLEDNTMEIDPQTEKNNMVEENRNIISSNEINGTTRQNGMNRLSNNTDETRSNNTLETTPRSNTDNRSGITRQNNSATGGNANVSLENTRRNDEDAGSNDPTLVDGSTTTTTTTTEATVTNPFETEEVEAEGETLDDLGPELAKMGRILAREITKSLSKALIPLQNEINDLKTTNSTPPGGNEWQ